MFLKKLNSLVILSFSFFHKHDQEDNWLNWINGNLLIEARISDITGGNPSSAQIFVNRYVTFTETCNVEPIANIENEVLLSFDSENFFSLELDMETKPDGWYELVILIPNPDDNMDFYTCLPFKLNNLTSFKINFFSLYNLETSLSAL